MDSDSGMGKVATGIAFVAIGAVVVYCLQHYTTWIDGLQFNPWWVLAPIGILATISKETLCFPFNNRHHSP